jgi:glycosyltransferase involved in cell wall biosynthesis
MTTRPLLMLTMIVKDEARTLARTLRSVRPFIDTYAILDTGSTDGTQDLIRQELEGVPGVVYEEPFVDFATTRNRSLALCGDAAEFVLWLDADDELKGGDALRRHLEGQPKGAPPFAYYLRMSMGGTAFDSARIVTRGSPFRFVGAVHEVLVHPAGELPAPRIDGVEVLHTVDQTSEARSRERWERDVKLLEAELIKDPGGTRSAFYLGMTLRWLGRHEEAMGALASRIALGGWAEEVYYARLSLARSARDAGRPWPEVLGYYLEAHGSAPQRAEPLYDIAMHYDRLGDHALALLFARRAYELPLPERDVLFVEAHIHAYSAADLVGAHAYWLGEFTLGEEAARKAASARPHDGRLAKNLGFYEARKKKA